VKPPRAERMSLPGPAGALEALIETPAEAAADGAVRAFGVVCHPHPLFGGTLDNKVVWTLARACQALGAPTIRFNFRGVGSSAGAYDEGRGEKADALAVIAWGRARWPHAALWLSGFSFGAAVALLAAEAARPSRLITVAPGITAVEVSGAAAPECPWLIVQGDADEVVPTAQVLEWARTLSPAPEIALLPGASHFFHGRINELREVLVDFLTRAEAREL
jgi:alpha/beta superfamily hydrolase